MERPETEIVFKHVNLRTHFSTLQAEKKHYPNSASPSSRISKIQNPKINNIQSQNHCGPKRLQENPGFRILGFGALCNNF